MRLNLIPPRADPEYRHLQQHLDRQAIGFPATRSGADIRFLKRMFTPDEAKLAMQLSYQPTATEIIAERATPLFSLEQTRLLLDRMFEKGAIGWVAKDGIDHWHLLPMIVGMYEAQSGQLTRDFLRDAVAYMKTLGFAKSFLAASPSQMRTIPIHKSITIEHAVSTYDQIRTLVQNARGPFVVMHCICREGQTLRRKPCAVTARLETCLGFDDVAAMVLRRNHGREITRDEALAILQQNEADGLVLQPSNTRQPGFVCSCCGCCCGMLGLQKMLPHPTDFWSSNYCAVVAADACTRCGRCVTRCQVNAITLSAPHGKAQINASRCIGCGLCVTTCGPKVLRLEKKASETIPPPDTESLYNAIMTNKKGVVQRWIMLLKVLLKLRQ